MQLLYLDIGNSFLKMAMRKKPGWQIVFDGELHRFDELCKTITSIKGTKKLLVSSVRKDIITRLNKSLQELTVQEYKTSDIPSRMLHYDTPETLGLDRFLVCLGAAKESSQKNVVVIDSGSACTIDLMTSERIYSGGVIMPGVKIIQRVMAERLPELPVVPESIPETWPGKSTAECIEWGVNGGFIFAIRGFISQYRSMVDEMDLYVTGGHGKQLLNWLGNEGAIRYRKNLIWDGMEEFGVLLKKINPSH